MENESTKFTREENRQAKKIRNIIKDPNLSLDELKGAIPCNSEIVGTLNCLATILKEEVDKDKKLSADFRAYLQEVTQVLKNCLKDNRISENERVKIIEALYNYGIHYAEVEKERERQSGKNKRFFGGVLAALGGLVIIIKNIKTD